MSVQLITYHGQLRAVCTPRRVFLTDEPDPHTAEPADTPFVLAMCLYAGAILNGYAPGPYREQDARAYARECLIPTELLEQPRELRELDALTAWLGIPGHELRLAIQRHHRPCQRATARPARRRGSACETGDR